VKTLCCKNPPQTREHLSNHLETVSAPCYRFFIPRPFTTRWTGHMVRNGLKPATIIGLPIKYARSPCR
jgi:hypothetical protein